MHWIIIFGILLILIIGIIITMIKIVRGSNDLQEMRERPTGRSRGVDERSGNRNRSSNDRGDSRSNSGRSSNRSDRSDRSNRGRDMENREVRHAPARKSDGRGGGRRRWKIILIDVATHEEYEFIFSDAIGVGRAFVKEGYEDYLIINDPKVSKRHCSIFAESDSLYIQDEGSSNGTYVNNRPVNRPMMVQKEDIIGIGNTELEVFKVFRESN